MTLGTWPGWYAVLIQLVGGALVILGLGTRAAAFIASGAMAFADFDVHQKAALWPIQNGGELPVLFCWSFLLQVFTGSGAFALDGLLARRSVQEPHPAAEQTAVTAQPGPARRTADGGQACRPGGCPGFARGFHRGM